MTLNVTHVSYLLPVISRIGQHLLVMCPQLYSNFVYIVLLQQHDYRSEQPVTIWTEIRDRAHVSEYLIAYCSIANSNKCKLLISSVQLTHHSYTATRFVSNLVAILLFMQSHR